MRRIVTAVLLVLTSGASLAADLPVKARKPPALYQPYDWSGLYVGAHVGAGFSYRNWTLTEGATVDAGDAVMLGGQVGYNLQAGRWVTGIEGDASWGNLKDESICPDGTNTCWTRQRWLSTATARLGYAFDPALFYLKGGAAFTHLDFFKTAQIPSVLDESGGGNRTGWVVGAGMDYALANSWILRLEYDYLDFGSRSVPMTNIASGAFAEDVILRNKAHEVKIGLNYLFNPRNWTPSSAPGKMSEPEPKRTGLPAPLVPRRSRQAIGRLGAAS